MLFYRLKWYWEMAVAVCSNKGQASSSLEIKHQKGAAEACFVRVSPTSLEGDRADAC